MYTDRTKSENTKYVLLHQCISIKELYFYANIFILRVLYSAGIYIADFLIKIISPFNRKLKLGVEGRKQTYKKLKSVIEETDRTLWFHCASLGEYEQGLPVFENLRTSYPDHKIVLSFFSPSGYEVKKDVAIADVVVYLPLDIKKKAQQFLDIIRPEYIVFVKYEIWPNFLNEIKKRKLNAILISGLFRKDQTFFKWYGNFMRKALFAFKHVFVQNESSKVLLETIKYDQVSVSGDTRFDRVFQQLSIDNTIDFIDTFKNNKTLVVFGSTWPEDDKLYIPFINNAQNSGVKFLIAPHNIKPSYIESIQSKIQQKSICYSAMEAKDIESYDVFILDTIGYLSKAYSYAEIAYVGGAAGTTGLHNILEPAVFGLPLIIGKNHSKFPEAQHLLDIGGLSSVMTPDECSEALNTLITNVTLRREKGQRNSDYIKNNTGAVIQILDYIRI